MSLRDEIVKHIEDCIQHLSDEDRPLKAADSILALIKKDPEMVEMKEKAEKWDVYEKIFSDIKSIPDDYAMLVKKLKDLDLIMDRMMVKEKCEHPDTSKHGLPSTSYSCGRCHGTGYIEREATPEEVRKALCDLSANGWKFVLTSGATLYMKEKDES